jgi:hypothetical protein
VIGLDMQALQAVEQEDDMNERMTRQQLDVMQCKRADCTETHGPLNLLPMCHPQAGNRVIYDRTDGTMTFYCHECEMFIASVVVAAGMN